MRVLFVYSNRSRDLLPAPPIGLSYVASATASAGHQVTFLDLLLASQGLDVLRRELQRHKPDIVGISVRNIDNVIHQRLQTHLDKLLRQIAVVRDACDAPIVLGGPAVSILGAETLKHLNVDFAILGEGEQSFPQLLKEITGDRHYHRVPGLCFWRGSDVVAVPPRPIGQFGDSNLGQWIGWRAYQRLGATWPVQTKRGCPLACSYCTYPAVEGQAIRRRPVEEVVDEIERVAKTIRPRCFEFIDSTFNVPENHAIAICEEINRRGLKVNLTAMGVNPLNISRQLLAVMKRAGFKSMMVTPESANDVLLDNLHKGFNVEHVHRAAHITRTSGIASMWFFMLGGPGETKETVEETVSFVERHLNWSNCLSLFTTGIRILPGTGLARWAATEGYLSRGQNLAEPVFYFSPHVTERWILRRIDRAIAKHPNIVHAADEAASRALTDKIYRFMHIIGVAPPYWRFLPQVLRLPPIRRQRGRGRAPPQVARAPSPTG